MALYRLDLKSLRSPQNKNPRNFRFGGPVYAADVNQVKTLHPRFRMGGLQSLGMWVVPSALTRFLYSCCYLYWYST
jgi:hypothetical protein